MMWALLQAAEENDNFGDGLFFFFLIIFVFLFCFPRNRPRR